MSFQQYNVYDGLTACRVVALANQAGTYVNGPLNNGVGATLTYTAPGPVTIDSVVLNVGDSVALVAQTNAWENGLYVVTNTGNAGLSGVLQRRSDFQCIEQLKAGQWTSIGAGAISMGSMFVLVEPLPATFGVDNLVLTAMIPAGLGSASTKSASNVGLASVASVSGATTINALAVFADVAGTLKDQTVASTLGFGLTLLTGNFDAAAGNVTAGSAANAGSLISFPALAGNGTLILSALNAGGAFNTTIRNSVMGQSTVYSIPDIGAATGDFVVSTSPQRMKAVQAAAVAGGAATQNVVDAFCTAGSVVLVNWVTQTNPAVIQTVVPGAGSFNVISNVDAGAGTLSYIILK